MNYLIRLSKTLANRKKTFKASSRASNQSRKQGFPSIVDRETEEATCTQAGITSSDSLCKEHTWSTLWRLCYRPGYE